MRKFAVKECVVELTFTWWSHLPSQVGWLFQGDDDRRLFIPTREEATVFPNTDAAIAAAETYLVESEAKVDSDELPEYKETYRVLRW